MISMLSILYSTTSYKRIIEMKHASLKIYPMTMNSFSPHTLKEEYPVTVKTNDHSDNLRQYFPKGSEGNEGVHVRLQNARWGRASAKVLIKSKITVIHFHSFECL